MFTYRFTRLFVALSASGLLAIALIWGLLASGARADAASTPAGAVRYVSPSGNDTGNDCQNSGAPCQSVQHAINLAQEADEIRVASGTYTGIMTSFIPAWNDNVTATVVITKNIGALLGGFNADFSLRDPDLNITKLSAIASPGDFVVFISGTTTLVNGFTITGSDGSNTGYGAGVRINGGSPKLQNNRISGNRAPLAGGGIYVTNNAAPVIASNIIESNTAGEGAGIYVRSGAALIAENKIRSNVADTGGGGIYIRNAPVTITSNTIVSNTAEGGAGITFESAIHYTITHNIISNNQAQLYSGGGIAVWGGGNTGVISYNEIIGNDTADHGGGIAINGNDEIAISHNDIRQNLARYGGGGIHINAEGSDVPLSIVANVVYSNTAEYGAGVDVRNVNAEVLIDSNDVRFNQTTGPDYSPGGIYVDNAGSTVTLINNVVAENANRGVKGVNYTAIELINNTIVGNGASAIEMHAWPITATVPMTTTLINNIIADHPDCALSGFYGAVFAVHHNDVVGHALDDCGAAIVAQSNNINADPLFVNPSQDDYHIRFGSPAMNTGARTGAPVYDKDGVVRPQGSGVDMGAYEVNIPHAVYLPLTMKR